jgi:succinate dehydrogenase/fumarate reductase flavoprotein subunit
MDGNIKTDILVIGGGSAGCMAAIKAKDVDPRLSVTVVEKAHVRRSGAVAMGMDAMNIVAVPGVSSPEEYVESMRVRCDGILDEELCLLMAKSSFPMIKKLESWGVSFAKGPSGEYETLKIHPKGRFLLPMVAPDLKTILFEQVQKRAINVVNHTMVTSLVAGDGRVIGATCFNVRTGEVFCIQAKATILATGCAGRFGLPPSGYLYGTYECPSNAGDGYSLAYNAGAELTGFEYTIRSLLIKDFNGPLWYIAVTRGAKIINGLGEELKVDGLASNRYIADAVFDELHEGKGPIYIQFEHLPQETINEIEGILFSTERPTQERFFAGRGIDLKRDLVELRLTEVFLCGGHGITGLVVNTDSTTSLEGLLAAGDVAAVPMQHLTGAFVFGSIAGETAAHIASSHVFQDIDQGRLEVERDRILRILDQKGGIDLKSFEYKVRNMINEYLPSPKNEMKLKTALWWVERFRKDFPDLNVKDAHELGRTLEIQFILDCAEMSARSSLKREESRWGLNHFRSDFPQRDDHQWLKHVNVRKSLETGEMDVYTRPVKISRK